MIVPLVKIIENLAAGKKEMAIAYAKHLVKNCERNYELFGGVGYYNDRMTARNVLHTLKGEQKEGGVAVLDGVSSGGCKNALGKLAHELEMFSAFNKDADRVNGYVLTKAKQVIEKLAEVASGHWENICDGPTAYICDASELRVQCCIGHCVDIAAKKEAK